MEDNEARLTISQLAEVSGVHPSTIKFYIAEGLVPRGELIASNRAVYGSAHIARLAFIRTLVTVGGVSISTLKDVVAALADSNLTTVLAAAQDAVRESDDSPPARAQTLDRVRKVFGIDSASPLFHHPSIRRIAGAIDASEPYLGEGFDAWIDSLMGAAGEAARADLDLVTGVAPHDAAQYAVVGIPLGDVVIAQSRRLWESVLTSRAFGPGPQRLPED